MFPAEIDFLIVLSKGSIGYDQIDMQSVTADRQSDKLKYLFIDIVMSDSGY